MINGLIGNRTNSTEHLPKHCVKISRTRTIIFVRVIFKKYKSMSFNSKFTNIRILTPQEKVASKLRCLFIAETISGTVVFDDFWRMLPDSKKVQ